MRAQGMLGIVVGRGAGGTHDDVLKSGAATGDADQTFGHLGAPRLPTTGGADVAAPRGGGGTGTIGTVDDPVPAPTPGPVAIGERGNERVPGLKQLPPKKTGPGTIDLPAVISAIHERRGAILACYDRALRHQPSLAGKLEILFTIDTEGAVDVGFGADTLEDSDVRACIATSASSWRLPPAANGTVTVAFPFIFQPSH
jgi:hypothetical protein